MQLGHYASLNHNIYIVAEPTPVHVDHDAHVGDIQCISCRQAYLKC